MKKLTIYAICFFVVLGKASVSNSQELDDWPAPPEAAKGLTVKLGPQRSEIPRVTFSPEVLESPPDDPLQLFPQELCRGIIVNLPYLKVEGYNESQQYYSLYGVNYRGLYKGELKSQITLHATYSISYLQSPVFSPNGRKVLYKGGSPFNSGASYRLFSWDFDKKIIDQAMIREKKGEGVQIIPHSHFNVYWSPDSRYVLYTIPHSKINPVGVRMPNHSNITLNAYDTEEKKNIVLADHVALGVLVTNIRDFTWQGAPYSTFGWTPQHTVLYTKQQMRTEEEILERRRNELLEPYRPHIYEVSLRGSKPELLISNGTNPLPSPDGKSIAFWGWPEDTEKTNKKEEKPRVADTVPKPELPALYVYDRATKQRRKVSDFLSGRLVWTPDSSSLLILGPSNAATGKRENTLYRIDVASARTVKVADIIAPDAKEEMREYRYFDNLKVSRNGEYAIVDTSYGLGSDPHGFVNPEMKVFLGVNLEDGKITKIAQCENKWASVLGWDWYDLSE